jgi:hypothetical protein
MQPETKHGMRDDLIRRLLNVGLRAPVPKRDLPAVRRPGLFVMRGDALPVEVGSEGGVAGYLALPLLIA